MVFWTVLKMANAPGTQPETEIRQAQREDAETVFELIRALAHFHGDQADFRATLQDVLRDGFGETPIYESWLVETEGKAQGLATFFLTYSTFKGKPCLHLDNLFVQDNARGQGIGEKLIARVSLRALELNCWRMELHVHKRNSACVFYEKLGFSQSPDRVYFMSGEGLELLGKG